MDDSRPGNHKDVTGEDLIIAFENLLGENLRKKFRDQVWDVILNGNNF
jgi:hypothetical protein